MVRLLCLVVIGRVGSRLLRGWWGVQAGDVSRGLFSGLCLRFEIWLVILGKIFHWEPKHS
jgi:hypothetical protein